MCEIKRTRSEFRSEFKTMSCLGKIRMNQANSKLEEKKNIRFGHGSRRKIQVLLAPSNFYSAQKKKQKKHRQQS